MQYNRKTRENMDSSKVTSKICFLFQCQPSLQVWPPELQEKILNIAQRILEKSHTNFAKSHSQHQSLSLFLSLTHTCMVDFACVVVQYDKHGRSWLPIMARAFLLGVHFHSKLLELGVKNTSS